MIGTIMVNKITQLAIAVMFCGHVIELEILTKNTKFGATH